MNFRNILLAQKTGYIPQNHFDALFARRIGGAVLKDFPGLPASIVTVTDALAKPLDSLKIAITPVQSGSGDPSPDNIRPISGWTGCNVWRTGKNLLNPENLNYVTGHNEDYSEITFYRKGFNVDFYTMYLPAGAYTISQTSISGKLDRLVDDSTGASIKRIITPTDTFTLDKGMTIRLRRADNSPAEVKIENLRIFSGTTDYSFVPYTGQDYTITFPSEAGTVYGGTLDVVNGVLTVTHKCVDLGKYTWTRTTNAISYVGFYAVISDKIWKTESTVISSRYKATNKIRTQLDNNEIGVFNTNSSGSFRQAIVRDDTFASYTPEQVKEALDGVQYYYEISTPITYQLTPTEVQMLLGTNNLWADTGDILEGKYWGKKSSATRAMLNTLRDAGEITPTEEPEENNER